MKAPSSSAEPVRTGFNGGMGHPDLLTSAGEERSSASDDDSDIDFD